MTQRNVLITLALAAVLALFAWWIAANTEWREEEVSTLPKGEALTNPLYAATKLAEALDARVEGDVGVDRLPPGGAVMVLTADVSGATPEYIESLRAWVEEGGRLVLPVHLLEDEDSPLYELVPVRTRFLKNDAGKTGQSGSLDDLPVGECKRPPGAGDGETATDGTAPDDADAQVIDSGSPEQLAASDNSVTEMRSSERDDSTGPGRADDQNAQAKDQGSKENDEHDEDLPDLPLFKKLKDKLLKDCTALYDDSPAGAEALRGLRDYQLCMRLGRYVLEYETSQTSQTKPVWRLRGERGDVISRFRMGQGSVTVLLRDEFFDNEHLLEGGNARVFIAATGLRSADVLWFVTRGDSDSLFTLIWRHGAPVVLLLAAALLLALWRGFLRFGPVAAEPGSARRSLAEQIRGTAEFVLRYRRGNALHAAQLRALREAAELHIQGWRQMTPEAQAAALAQIANMDAASIEQALRTPAQGRRRDLDQALAVLETVRRALIDRS